MVESFLSLSARERADILRTAAARSRRSIVILEKDIWICWVLVSRFSMSDPHPMAFKGGTSLSKVYGLIDRFSEDVDVTLDMMVSTPSPRVSAAPRSSGSANFSGTTSRAMSATPPRPLLTTPPGASRPMAATTSMSAKTARPSASPIRPRSMRLTAVSRAKSCWSSAAATSSIRTNGT